ncbi:MAG: PilZ domain-containing protein [Armatimonadetes bacterium]|nr:PilZ domain-containing protein [Armatimonadota bacterium]
MERTNQSDRRNFARFEILDYAMVNKVADESTVRSVVVDVSLGGCQIRSREQFEPGTKYVLSIGRGNNSPVSIQAEARYSKLMEDCDLYATGFKFSSGTEAERMAWAEYVHEVFKEQGEMLLG